MPRRVAVRLSELRAMEYAIAKLLERLERGEDKFRLFNGYRGTLLHLGDLRKDSYRQIVKQES